MTRFQPPFTPLVVDRTLREIIRYDYGGHLPDGIELGHYHTGPTAQRAPDRPVRALREGQAGRAQPVTQPVTKQPDKHNGQIKRLTLEDVLKVLAQLGFRVVEAKL